MTTVQASEKQSTYVYEGSSCTFADHLGEHDLNAHNAIGLGAYPIMDAARLTRVPAQKIRDWVYGRGSGSPVVKADLEAEDGQEALSFVNLIEVRFLAELRGQGVTLQAIRKMVDVAARVLDQSHPFASSRFHTDGKTVFIETAEATRDRSLISLVDGNGAMIDVLERSFKRTLTFGGANGLATSWQPSEALDRVVLDPLRSFGRPIDKETGVPTSVLADAYRQQDGDAARAAAWWEVPVEAVIQAAEFELFLNKSSAT